MYLVEIQLSVFPGGSCFLLLANKKKTRRLNLHQAADNRVQPTAGSGMKLITFGFAVWVNLKEGFTKKWTLRKSDCKAKGQRPEAD